MNAPVEVIVRDLSSGRFHKRIRVEGQTELASFEGCQADQSGAYQVVEGVTWSSLQPEALCKRCFPEPVEPADTDPVPSE